MFFRKFVRKLRLKKFLKLALILDRDGCLSVLYNKNSLASFGINLKYYDCLVLLDSDVVGQGVKDAVKKNFKSFREWYKIYYRIGRYLGWAHVPTGGIKDLRQKEILKEIQDIMINNVKTFFDFWFLYQLFENFTVYSIDKYYNSNLGYFEELCKSNADQRPIEIYDNKKDLENFYEKIRNNGGVRYFKRCI